MIINLSICLGYCMKRLLMKSLNIREQFFVFYVMGNLYVIPRFKEMLRYAKDQNIAPMNFITNGLLLDESMANFILNIGIEAVRN